MTKEELERRNQRSQSLQVYQVSDQEYLVESSQKKISYKVVLRNGEKSCTCGDYATNVSSDPDFMCKHIIAVLNGNNNLKKVNHFKQKPKLDERWITNIKNKEFVVYSGLLDLAHQIGINSIDVTVVQYPSKENGFEAICRAETCSSDGQVFADYGDANPKNTNSLVVNHILRVSATRAKARTLRDMTNIGMTCLEELGGEEEIDAAYQPAKTPTKSSSQSSQSRPQNTEKKAAKATEQNSSQQNSDNNGAGKPSSAQYNAIKNLAFRRGLSEEEMEKLAKEKLQIASMQELTSKQASQFIKLLQQSA